MLVVLLKCSTNQFAVQRGDYSNPSVDVDLSLLRVSLGAMHRHNQQPILVGHQHRCLVHDLSKLQLLAEAAVPLQNLEWTGQIL